MATAGFALTDSTTGKVQNTLTTPAIVTTSGDKTLAITDADTLQDVTAAANITVPANATVAFGIGTTIIFFRDTASAVVIVAADGVTISNEVGLTLNAQNSVASIIKIATNTWVASGSLKA